MNDGLRYDVLPARYTIRTTLPTQAQHS